MLAHTFGYAVLLGVVACAVDEGALRARRCAGGERSHDVVLALVVARAAQAATRASTWLELFVYAFFVLWDVFAAPVGLMAALMLSSVTAGAWAFALLFLWDGLGVVLRFFFRSQRG